MAKPGKKNPPSPATQDRGLTPGMGQALVRMYRQGLGDCFLVRLPRRDGQGYFSIMIDCGVIVGTENPEKAMQDVVDDIRRTTGGVVDLLVVTHEHWDHVSGFTQAESLFARQGERDAAGKLQVRNVWCAWTEDEKDPLANELQAGLGALLARTLEKAQKLHSFAAASTGPDAEEAQRKADNVAGLLAFLGLEPGEVATGAGMGVAGRVSKTKAALNAAKRLAPVTYHLPGEPPTYLRNCDVRIYVLGPPRDIDMLRRTEPAREGYHLADIALDGAVLQTGPEWDNLLFEDRFALPLSGSPMAEPAVGDDPYQFLWTHYLADKVKEARTFRRTEGEAQAPADLSTEAVRSGDRVTRDVLVNQHWRRIEADEAEEGGELALQLDGATNNTSLVLALELGEAGAVLLFVGDAQAGNWLSWDAIPAWKVNGKTVGVDDLLARTVFYKVGHHGSHNATLKGRGLQKMTHGDLIAFVPVDRLTARRKRWNRMPLPSIIETLKAMTGNRVVLSERAVPDGEEAVAFDFRDGFARDPDDRLWYEVIVPAVK